jgi:hypothetical protein
MRLAGFQAAVVPLLPSALLASAADARGDLLVHKEAVLNAEVFEALPVPLTLLKWLAAIDELERRVRIIACSDLGHWHCASLGTNSDVLNFLPRGEDFRVHALVEFHAVGLQPRDLPRVVVIRRSVPRAVGFFVQLYRFRDVLLHLVPPVENEGVHLVAVGNSVVPQTEVFLCVPTIRGPGIDSHGLSGGLSGPGKKCRPSEVFFVVFAFLLFSRPMSRRSIRKAASGGLPELKKHGRRQVDDPVAAVVAKREGKAEKRIEKREREKRERKEQERGAQQGGQEPPHSLARSADSTVARRVVTFKVTYPELFEDEYIPFDSPYIRLNASDNRRSIKYLCDPDEAVIEAESVVLVIDHPVVREKRVALKASNGTAFTRVELVRKIASAYHKMYTEEERTTTSLPVESMMQRTNGACALTNRAKTDGMWGISGYYLCDLLLHALYYDPPTNTVRLGIDS